MKSYEEKVVIMLLACSMALSFTACGSSPSNEIKTEQKAPEEKEYVDDINAVVANPDSYKENTLSFAEQFHLQILMKMHMDCKHMLTWTITIVYQLKYQNH